MLGKGFSDLAVRHALFRKCWRGPSPELLCRERSIQRPRRCLQSGRSPLLKAAGSDTTEQIMCL
jgi:hypothetical protein